MAADGENTPQIGRADHLKGHQFKPGNGGRPKGARNKLGEAFIKELLADFEKGGKAAIETVRAERPQDYLKVVASILPKEVSGLDGEPIVAEIRRVIVDP